MRLKLLVLGIAVLIGVTLAWPPSPSGAHEPDVQPCGSESAVLGDSQDWTAVELVGFVLGTDCLLDSGDRNADTLPTAALARYNAQAVYIVGGRAAVPESKLFELNVAERFGGVDRTATMWVVVEWAYSQRTTASTGAVTAPRRGTGLL